MKAIAIAVLCWDGDLGVVCGSEVGSIAEGNCVMINASLLSGVTGGSARKGRRNRK